MLDVKLQFTSHIARMRSVNKVVPLILNPLTAKLFNYYFNPLKVVSRWRDSQRQVSKN